MFDMQLYTTPRRAVSLGLPSLWYVTGIVHDTDAAKTTPRAYEGNNKFGNIKHVGLSARLVCVFMRVESHGTDLLDGQASTSLAKL
jgi:hypothetical protein